MEPTTESLFERVPEPTDPLRPDRTDNASDSASKGQHSDRLDSNTQHLGTLIERQLNILSALKLLATQQAESLGADDVEILLSLLARKQPLLEELLQLQTQLNPYRHQDPELRIWSDADQRERCKKMLAGCDQLHQEIMHLESHALDELEVHRNAVAAQLQECRDATLAATAYAAEAILVESHFDLTNS